MFHASDLGHAGAAYPGFGRARAGQTGVMLILSGLVHAKRRRALMALLWGLIAMAAVQKLEPEAQATERHVRASAWIHAMPHPSFMLAPPPPAFGAYDPANPGGSESVKGPHATPAAFGQTGEGWYAAPLVESGRAGR